MRRTFEELEILAYLQGRDAIWLAIVEQHLVDLNEIHEQDLQRIERERDEAQSMEQLVRLDLDEALKRIDQLESTLKQIHTLSTPGG